MRRRVKNFLRWNGKVHVKVRLRAEVAAGHQLIMTPKPLVVARQFSQADGCSVCLSLPPFGADLRRGVSPGGRRLSDRICMLQRWLS